MASKTRGHVCGQPVQWRMEAQQVRGQVDVLDKRLSRSIDVSVLFDNAFIEPTTLLNIVTAQIEADLAVEAYTIKREQRNDYAFYD